MSTPSIFSALQQLRSLLTRKEKMRWLGIISMALVSSCFEILTATVIVIFAQILNQPEIGQKYLVKYGWDGAVAHGRLVFYSALTVGGIYFIKNLFSVLEIFYQNFSIQKMNYEFKSKMLHRYAQMDYALYLTRNSSFGSQVISGDVEQLFSIGMLSLATIFSEAVVFCALTGMIIYMNPSLAVVIFAVIAVLALVIVKFLLPQFFRWGKALQEISVYGGQNLAQFFHGFKEIILLGKREAFVSAYDRFSQKKSHVQALHTATNILPRIGIEVLFVGLFVLAITVLCLEQESPVQMMGVLGGYLYTGFRLMPGLNRMITQLNSFKYVIPSTQRVCSEYHSVTAQENYIDVPEFQFQMGITLKNVKFRYLNTKKDAIKEISLEIRKGESIGIVGETGSGKSTLVDLILGLLRPYEGSILVDNQYPINSYQWHQKIGYVPQMVYLIDDTIEANIAFGEQPIDEQRLNAAIDAAQLRKFIAQLPQASKTIVGERGIRLSGGERQRISIARALYHNPEVLIFDEATSALDNETEARLMETINAVSKDRTVIMIAHRLSTLKDCDRIVVMSGGEIGEITSWNKLQTIKV